MQGTSGIEFIDTWHVRDYLGSVRAVYDITPGPEDVTSAGSQILEQNDYYTFGGRIEVSGQAIGHDKSRAAIKTSTAKKEEIFNAARDIYQDYLELLKVIEEAFK